MANENQNQDTNPQAVTARVLGTKCPSCVSAETILREALDRAIATTEPGEGPGHAIATMLYVALEQNMLSEDIAGDPRKLAHRLSGMLQQFLAKEAFDAQERAKVEGFPPSAKLGAA